MIFSNCLSRLRLPLLGLVVVAPAFATDTVYLEVGHAYGGNQQNPYQASDGGEFTALTNTGIPAGYSSLATLTIPNGGYDAGVTGFETFCIEDQTYFYVGTTYDYQVSSDIWIPAGGAVEGNNGTPYTTTPLSAGAAWLYEQFATGLLGTAADASLYNYTNTAARLADAGALQTALWELQGNPADPTDVVNLSTSNNAFVNLAISALGSVANTQVAAGDTYGVQVMDLYSTDSNGNINGVYQDQLIYTGPHVPETSATIALLGLGLLGLAAAGRRIKAVV
jgi:hypothetical protein